MKNLKRNWLFLLFAVVVLTYQCTKDNTDAVEEANDQFQTSNKEAVLSLFQNSANSAAARTSDTSVSFAVANLDAITQEPLSNSTAMITVIPAVIPDAPNIYSRALALDYNNKTHTAILTLLPNQSDQSNGFSGHYVSYTLEGEPINAFRVESDTIVAKLILPRDVTDYGNIISPNTLRTSSDCNCNTSPLPDCCFEMQSLDEIVITVGTGGIPPQDLFEPSNHEGLDLDAVAPITFLAGGGGGSTSSNCSEGYVYDSFLGCVLEEQIDTSALTGKEKCAYDALEAANGDLFNETIATFGVEGSKYNLTFIYGSCPSSGGEACTVTSDLINNNLTIKIADRGLSVLEQAANLLHEGIHAEIYRYVNENGGVVDPNDRINLYNKYKEFKVENGSLINTPLAHHEHMADRYVYPIARAIRELDDFRFPVESYLSFGWSGISRYGVNGYYNENIQFVYFDDNNVENKIKDIVDTTSVGNNCEDDD